MSELIEENEKNKELSEVERKNNFKAWRKTFELLSNSERFKEKKSQEIFLLHSVWKEIDKQISS